MLTNVNLKSKKEELLTFELSYQDLELLKQIEKAYLKLPKFDSRRSYRNNMIKTTISDIDLEKSDESSVIESVAAICCGKIKNKNQKTALNMLQLLETGLLEESNILSNAYLIAIWDALTMGNRNIEAFKHGYRKTPVVITKNPYFPYGKNVVYRAPSATQVPIMMDDLILFMNKENFTALNLNNFSTTILKSIIFSAYFVYVHPFLDGNGRTSRLVMTKFLIDSGLSKFRYLSINSEIMKSKSEYIVQLKKIESDRPFDFSDYIRFMLIVYFNLFDRLINPKRNNLDYYSLSERERIMLNIIKGQIEGIHGRLYKELWNGIALEQNKEKINIEKANKDIEHMFLLDFLVVDERYNLYPGFKYYNK